MFTISDNLIAELRLYIREQYKLVSFSNIFRGKNKAVKRGISGKAKGIRSKSFDEVTELMSGFIKDKRDFDSFAFSLDKLRKEKGLSPAELYKAAWIDKRLYSKIMSTGNYRPAKATAIAFGLALKLNPKDFTAFLRNAGYALSDSSISDLVIRFCVERMIYDLHDVNALLLQADQKTLVKEAA